MYSQEELVQPFFFSGGNIGILLVHGFTACPVDMEPLGQYFSKIGYTVYAPLLAGHGTSPDEMKGTSWKDWVKSAAEGLYYIKEQCLKVVVIGHSMGGLISLLLASQGEAAAVVSINAPIIYRDKSLHFAERLLGKQEYVDKPHKESDISITKEGLPHFSYSKVPVECLVSLNKAITPVQNELRKIECPALIIQSLKDNTVHPRSGRMIEKSIRHRRKDVIYWSNEDHYLPLSAQRELLAEKTEHFLMKYNLSTKTHQ